MNRFTYYSPMLLGIAAVLLLNPSIRQARPAGMPAWAEWPFLIAVGIVAGLACQLWMIGAQGAFAQVLPVPGGRSIRGRGAMAAGWLLKAGVAAAVGAALLSLEGVSIVTSVMASISGAALVASGGVYAWCWPTAVRDFAD